MWLSLSSCDDCQSADDGRLAEAAYFYVVRFMTGSDQRYKRDKLRTWSNGMSSQQMCHLKNNNMLSKINRRVTQTQYLQESSQRNSKTFLSWQSYSFWDITKYTRCFLKRGEELYHLHSYTACCTAKLCRNETSDLDVILPLIHPILFSVYSSAPISARNTF